MSSPRKKSRRRRSTRPVVINILSNIHISAGLQSDQPLPVMVLFVVVIVALKIGLPAVSALL